MGSFKRAHRKRHTVWLPICSAIGSWRPDARLQHRSWNHGRSTRDGRKQLIDKLAAANGCGWLERRSDMSGNDPQPGARSPFTKEKRRHIRSIRASIFETTARQASSGDTSDRGRRSFERIALLADALGEGDKAEEFYQQTSSSPPSRGSRVDAWEMLPKTKSSKRFPTWGLDAAKRDEPGIACTYAHNPNIDDRWHY